MERSLEGYDLVALFLDGKTFGEDSMVLAVGVTVEGRKVMLGMVQTATENERVCSEFLSELVERGLRYQEGLLVIMDGSKGLRKAVKKVFGPMLLIQRCQWHKRENVVSYLPKRQQSVFRKKLQKAYEKPTYREAKKELALVRKELELVNESAVRSLEEGLEETLTLHRLGLFPELGTSFKTTNCLESIMAQVGLRTDKVDYWKNSNQKQRWMATALLDIEPRLRKIKGYRHLPQLQRGLERNRRRTMESGLSDSARRMECRLHALCRRLAVKLRGQLGTSLRFRLFFLDWPVHDRGCFGSEHMQPTN